MILELIERLTREAGSRGLDFLLIGGHALAHHGYIRMTRDIDLLAKEAQRPAWRDLLQQCEYRVLLETPAFAQFDPLSSGSPPVDIMFVHDDTWSKLRSEAERKQSGQAEVVVPSARHMVALKLHAASSPNRRSPGKDWADIEELVRRHKLDPHNETFAELIRRYGGEAAVDRIRALWEVITKESSQ